MSINGWVAKGNVEHLHHIIYSSIKNGCKAMLIDLNPKEKISAVPSPDE